MVKRDYLFSILKQFGNKLYERLNDILQLLQRDLSNSSHSNIANDIEHEVISTMDLSKLLKVQKHQQLTLAR